MIIGFLHLNKAKRQAIDKQCYIRAEFILPILTGKLRCKMEEIIFDIVKIYKLYRRDRFKTIVETTSQIIIIQFFLYILEHLQIFTLVTRIQLFELLLKYLNKNISVTIIDGTIHILTEFPKI